MSDQQANIPARHAYAQLLRQFHSGRMTNFEYEDRYSEIERTLGSDRLIDDIYLVNWHSYCDIQLHRMVGKWKLSRTTRRYLAQAVLMLKTGFEAEPLTPEQLREEARNRNRLLVALIAGALVVIGLIALLPAWVFLFICAGMCFGVWAWFGLASLVQRTSENNADAECDLDEHWPFASQSDLASAKQQRVYLCGSAA
jgi:hypothetical protein